MNADGVALDFPNHRFVLGPVATPFAAVLSNKDCKCIQYISDSSAEVIKCFIAGSVVSNCHQWFGSAERQGFYSLVNYPKNAFLETEERPNESR